MLTSFDELEKAGNDDLYLLDSVGPGEFPTEHLIELRDTVRTQLLDFKRRQRVNMIAGAIAAGWVCAFMAAYAYNNVWLALVSVIGLVFSLGACLAGIFLLRIHYKSLGELTHALITVEAELKRRFQV